MANQPGKQTSTPLVLFTGGGTGGHVYPGLAVLDRVVAAGLRTAWIGGSRGMERSIVLAHGVEYHGIPVGKLRRYLSIQNLLDVFRVGAGIVRSIGIVRRLRPRVLFSKGGFVSVPPVIACWLHRVPVISHESDSDPGLATRINARFSRVLLVPYQPASAPRSIARTRTVVTGNPLRPEIFRGSADRGIDAVGFARSDPRAVLLVLGGSLGASQLNDAVERIRREIAPRWRIVHQTGAHAGAGSARVCDDSYFRTPFLRAELPDVLAAADLVLCRAGASTIWEAAALAKPMILVPLIVGSRGDQVRNAERFVSVGGARVLTNPHTLDRDIVALLEYLDAHPDERRMMATAARGVVALDATERIYRCISGVLEGA